MEYVDAFVPLYLPKQPFACGEAEVRIRPNYDEAFPWDIAADVEYLGSDDKWHPCTEQLSVAILEDIRLNDKDKWAEILSAAKANFAPELVA